MKTNVVYKGIATTTVNSEKTYIGITEGPWKHRHFWGGGGGGVGGWGGYSLPQTPLV